MADNEVPVSARKLAHTIEVEQLANERGFRFRIDGEEFPWFISESGISTGTTVNELPYIDVRIIAERVYFTNDWRR